MKIFSKRTKNVIEKLNEVEQKIDTSETRLIEAKKMTELAKQQQEIASTKIEEIEKIVEHSKVVSEKLRSVVIRNNFTPRIDNLFRTQYEKEKN